MCLIVAAKSHRCDQSLAAPRAPCFPALPALRGRKPIAGTAMTGNEQKRNTFTLRSPVRNVALLVGAAALAVAPWGDVAGSTPASSGPARPPDTCIEGTKWRLAAPVDHVCIGASRQTYFNWETFMGQFRSDASTGNGCKAGYVPREAVPGDKVCVTPAERDEVQRDAERAPSNWRATADRVIWGNLVPIPFVWNRVYSIHSDYTSERNGLHRLAVDTGGRYGDAASVILSPSSSSYTRYWFRTQRTRDGSAFRNRFEIVAAGSGKCLDVVGARTHDGARVVEYPCSGGTNQRWYLERRADNRWQIRNWNSDKCLDAHNPDVNNAPPQGTYLQQWTCLGNKNQAWRILM
ncbi:RICIN domain-containing protein [Streptomyces sp. MSC1_001]|uniref:RICIN domain-containing protein n=1 Tax=Streptomyces sp. MSC1_001 TaxID=2909263 RepID=UPI0035B0407C